jgi:hypothetical protein
MRAWSIGWPRWRHPWKNDPDDRARTRLAFEFHAALLIQIKPPRSAGRFMSSARANALSGLLTRTRMSDNAKYSAREHLRDGSPVEVRALRPEDEADMLAALDQASPQSLQRRFFAMKRHFR